MKRLRLGSAVAFLALLTTPLVADGLVTYREWGDSAQAYFMTRGEREEWAAVHTDDAAQLFVERFLASRSPGFAAEVADRASQADKHLSIGRIPGSRTLRGKIIVVLGPPTGLDISEITDTQTHRDSPAMANIMSGGTNSTFGDGKSGGGGPTADNTGKSMSIVHVTRNFHFIYAKTPAGPLDVNVSADTNMGKDRARSRDDAKKLDEAFEAAAQASLKKP